MNPIGRDLKLLRTEKKYSLEDVHQFTKIPLYRLEGIEDGRIFKDLMKEPTVLRSFIRGYGKALGIPDQTMVDALDLEKSGRYSQELIEWVEKNKSWRAAKSAKSDSESDTSGVKKKIVRKKVVLDEDSETPTSTTSGSTSTTSSALPNSASEKSAGKNTDSKFETTPEQKTQSLFDQPNSSSGFFTLNQTPALPNIAPEAPSVENIDWAGKKISNIRVGHPRLIFFIVVAILSVTLIGAIIWGISRFFSSDADDTSSDQTEQTSDGRTSEVSSNGDIQIEQGEIVTLPVQSLAGSNQARSMPAEPQNRSSNSGSQTGIQNNDARNDGDIDQSSSSEPTSESSEANDASSSAAQSTSQSASQTSTSESTRELSANLPPFEILIYAHSGPVGTLQFSVDDNSTRRNVRLAQGEAFRIQPNQEIRFDGAYSSMMVFINGEPIDNFQELFFDRRQRQVVLSRELLDGLSNADPRDLRLPQGVNPPASIRELP